MGAFLAIRIVDQCDINVRPQPEVIDGITDANEIDVCRQSCDITFTEFPQTKDAAVRKVIGAELFHQLVAPVAKGTTLPASRHVFIRACQARVVTT